MKKISILLIGLLIAYPLFCYLGHNNGVLYKIPFVLVTFITFQVFISRLLSDYEDKSWHKSVSGFTIIVVILLTVATHETFEVITYGSREDQAMMLTKSKSFAVAKVLEVEHFDSFSIKNRDIPEHWEVKYEFRDVTNQTFKGIYRSNILPNRQVGDTLTVKYVKENPELNEQLKK
ncbi:MAG: hypothetical protein KA313_03490 [Pseudarcicella sp.]|nr:hypothetical protein [Pseudarcicella sp.]MBP6410137.1 hypothetical protein [Pseudarcicella sp.]